MLFEIKLEKLSYDVTEKKVTRIYKGVGDELNVGEILFDLEGGKANIPVKSEFNGTIESISVEVGQVVKIGDILAAVNGEKAEAESSIKAAGYYGYFGL
ncbi:Biotin-requiring enzyme [Desulfotomaculum arcticum]|uniref:Biotin-requiring enzyme n=1 Tax=Desulfotruncus arcticus DSM 17038 TaxID=1121424 RepID=A0A1I2XYA5_9FIRM|nr:biotin/lipoyl-containing protein [Desulfotruncus arcticus]SFH18490.1 Biotin-requiring enzyme [Desulfotomaculum arcticum] [Desulfotruncus arcticus DSM 17038]